MPLKDFNAQEVLCSWCLTLFPLELNLTHWPVKTLYSASDIFS